MFTTKLLGLLAFVSSISLGLAGCASNIDDDEQPLDDSESELTGSRSVSLKYEGTCDFLRSCSSYSRNLPAGKVAWGCTGVGVCSDSALWVAGPNRSYCGKTVQICKGSQCTDALVKDISVSHSWEASNGVLDALDLPRGLHGRCSGYGGGKVTVSFGSSSRESPAPDSKDDSKDDSTSTPDDRHDSGCYSASFDKDEPELACVQSRKTKLFYQCKNGKWYRGVKGTTGPYGECQSVETL